MSLGIYTSVAWLASGGVAANATVEVRRMSDSGLAAIYSDAAGTAPITNPSAFVDSNGRFQFYAAQIFTGYSVKVTSGAFTYTLNNQLIGLFSAANAADARLLIGAAGSATLNGARYGNIYGHNAVDFSNDFDITAGGCMDVTGAYGITTAAMTKRADAAWAVGSGAGMLDTGAVGNSAYYIFAIARSDTGVTDYLSSLSSTAPTMPANYDFKRLIGWFKRLAGVNVQMAVYELDGGGIDVLWVSPTLDVNLTNTLTTSRRVDVVKVPLNFSVEAHLVVRVNDAAALIYAWVGCPDLADVTVDGSPVNSNIKLQVLGAYAQGVFRIRTSLSGAGTIAARANTATVDEYQISTIGFTWARRD